MKKGKLIVISGPSGVGKGTIREKLTFNNYVFSISSTTRKKRTGEKDGVHYHFITKAQFQAKIQNNEMLEYAEFVDNLYGTDKNEVMKQINQGNNVLLEIECQGALQVIAKEQDLLSIFIVPPSLTALEERLISRGTEDSIKIKNRLQKAEEEMKLMDKYQHIIVNDNIDHAVSELDKLLFERVANEV
ncbi:MAG: guanylate kinase [Mycoplasmatales bacterium]